MQRWRRDGWLHSRKTTGSRCSRYVCSPAASYCFQRRCMSFFMCWLKSKRRWLLRSGCARGWWKRLLARLLLDRVRQSRPNRRIASWLPRERRPSPLRRTVRLVGTCGGCLIAMGAVKLSSGCGRGRRRHSLICCADAYSGRSSLMLDVRSGSSGPTATMNGCSSGGFTDDTGASRAANHASCRTTKPRSNVIARKS